MHRCKILYVAEYSTGGSVISLCHLVNGLDITRYNPTVIFYRTPSPFISEKLTKSGAQIIVLKDSIKGMADPNSFNHKQRNIESRLEKYLGDKVRRGYAAAKAFYGFIRWQLPIVFLIKRIIEDHDIDLVHVNNGLSGSKPGIAAAWLSKVPCVTHVRMLSKLTTFDVFFSKFVDYFIYISSAVERHMISQGVAACKGAVIHNAVDMSEFRQCYDEERIKREFNWSKINRVVGIIGRLDWWKGHEYFLEAFAKVVKVVPQARALIVGAKEQSSRNLRYYRDLVHLSIALGLDKKVVFTGHRDDVLELMSTLDVLVLSSSNPEPFGRVIIEAMASGKPVVATSAGGVLDIIRHDVNGLLVPPKDSRELAAAIIALLCDRERAKRIAFAGQQEVEKRFSVINHVEAVQSVYRTMLEAKVGKLAEGRH